MHDHQKISRRSFIKATAVAATGASLGLSFGASVTDTKRKVVVGAHPWVYAAKLPNYDITPLLPQIFADFRYAGVDGIELMDVALKPDDAVSRIGELSLKHNMPVIGTSFGGAMWNRDLHQAVLDNAELVVTRLARLGGRTLGTSVGQLPPSTPSRRKTPDQLDAQAECLRKIIAICAKHGVVLNLHNHTYEVENDLHDLRGTLERIPNVRLGPDLNWLIRGNVDPVAFIHRYGRQVVFLHLRDQKKNGRWVEAMGEGDTDFASIAVALRDVEFTGDAVIELAHEKDFTPTRPLRESVRMSRDFVRNTFGF